MTAEVLYFVNGNGTDGSGGDSRKVHLEKGELILDDETDMVHSPLHKLGFYAPVGSLRKLIILETFMQDPERRFQGRYFLKEWGNVFHTNSDVSKSVWSLRLSLADIGMINHLSTSNHRRRKMHSLIHSGPEGYSLTPYIDEYLEQEEDFDNKIYLPGIPHIRECGILYESTKYDFTKILRRRD